MQGSMVQPTKQEYSQTLFLSLKDFSFLKDLSIKDKGTISFRGIVAKERVIEKEDSSRDEKKVEKGVKISELKLNRGKRP